MIKEKLGHRIDDWIHALFPFLFRRPIDPDLLTVVGTLVAASAGLAFAEGAFPLAGVLLLAGGFFDLVDGVVARHHGTQTRFGGFLDSTLDRLVDMTTFVGVALFFAIAGDPAGVALAGWALVASVMVSYAQARAELVLPSFKVGLLERGERVGILAAGAILGFLTVALWIIAIGSTITVFQRFARAHREMGRMEHADAANREESV